MKLRWRKWIVVANPMRLGLWQPMFTHWFGFTARQRARRMQRNYHCEMRARKLIFPPIPFDKVHVHKGNV